MPMPTHRQAVRVVTQNPLPHAGREHRSADRHSHVVSYGWACADALTFPLCISSIDRCGARTLTDVSVAWGNVVLADHGV